MPLDKPISTHTERLHVKLTPEELSSAGQRLAQLEGDWAQHCTFMKSEQSKMASRKKELEAQVQQLAATIRDKTELRDVPVNVCLDAGEALEIRTDTNEVVRRRPIRPDEQQGKLFGDDATEPADPGEDEEESH